jgi:hypothetical protein
LTATPNMNLVTNIGFGPEATHTNYDRDDLVIPVHPIGTLKHPRVVKRDVKADRYMFDHRFDGKYNRPNHRLHRRLFWFACRVGSRVLRTVRRTAAH